VHPKEGNPRLERVEFELRASGVKLEAANPLRSGTHTRGYLPHVKREGASYFVTFRLADSLPEAVLLKIQGQRAERLRRFHAEQEAHKTLGVAPRSADSLEDIERDYFREIERFLDQGAGACVLRRADVAAIVASALGFFDGQRYRLDAWVVMPNHVHVVVWPMANHALSDILHSWKRFTSRAANKVLGRTGETFWQRESYDHWIRNDAEHARCCRYTMLNPVKAKLCTTPEAWRWSSAWREAPTA
jgi:type I restriction enzyme R subunit/putative DNA methylase